MTITAIPRRVIASTHIAASGLPVDVPYSDVRVSAGFDQPVTTCQFTVPYLTARLALGTNVTLFFGATEVGEPVHQTQSFWGYIVGYQPIYYPRGVTVLCEGSLTKASHFKPTADVSYAGFTDITAINDVLSKCGIASNQRLILGRGEALGVHVLGAAEQDARFTWRKGQSGLDFIQSIDQISLGFRTYDWGGSGIVFRRIITGIPVNDPNWTFTEHVDISGGSGEWTLDRGAAGVHVQGAMGPSGSQIVANDTRSGLGSGGYIVINSPLVETTNQAQDILGWAVVELGRPLARLQFTTYRPEDVRPGHTVVLSSIERLKMNRRVWVQSVTRELSEDGRFQQTIGVVSEIIPDNTIVQDHLPGAETTYGGDLQPTPLGPDTSTPPYDALLDPVADFVFEFVDHEFDDLGNEFWIVIVKATAQAIAGTISTYAWETSTVTVPETGSAERFSFKTTDITGTVTLTVTDSGARSTAITKDTDGPEALAVTRDRHLYAASGSTNAIAYDGNSNWNTQAVTGTTDVVANGPVWNDGDSIESSTDDLATAPGIAPVFSGENVSALWCESDVSSTQVYAGGDGGGVARSTDGGGTWTIMTSPSANEILRIIASRFNPGEVLVLDDAGDVYQSLDYGASWGLIASHSGAVDLAQSNFRNWVGGTFGVKVMETGETATWPAATPSIVAIAAHIRDDVLYALASNGNTYYTSPAGGLAFVAGAALPSGTAVARGLTRDGSGVDLLYIAATDRILKSHDGLRTTDGYTVIYNDDAVSVGYGDFPLDFTAPPPPVEESLWMFWSDS